MISSREKYETYQKVALLRGQHYYEYENYQIPLNNQAAQNYEIITKIGRGKYSDVFKCMRISTNLFAVIKILKPVRQAKIKRQIKILKSIKHPNCVELYDAIWDKNSKNYCLAFQYIQSEVDYRQLYSTFKKNQIKAYIRGVLSGLDYVHSQGIMHRDIKPQNILLDMNKNQLKIADWGLADYYLPSSEYNVRVASRYYKGPELLLNNKLYDYSLDIWSLGVIFAGIIFKKPIIFQGRDNPDQLRCIMEVMGTKAIDNYIQKYKLKPDKLVLDYINSKQYPKIPWQKFINSNNQNQASQLAIDLLNKMLVIDHKQRISALQALQHPYLNTQNQLQYK